MPDNVLDKFVEPIAKGKVLDAIAGPVNLLHHELCRHPDAHIRFQAKVLLHFVEGLWLDFERSAAARDLPPDDFKRWVPPSFDNDAGDAPQAVKSAEGN